MKYIITIITLTWALCVNAQIPDNSWHYEGYKRFQHRWDTVNIFVPGHTLEKDALGTSLKSIGSIYDTVHTVWDVDTSLHIIYRSWIWKGKKRTVKIEYDTWENYETSGHDTRYLQNTVYFHTKGRGDIEWHVGEMIVWNNMFKNFRIEYYK
jgi:hypothetical protein